MNVTVERNALAFALGRIASIVDQKHTVPILANVCLSAAGEGLMIRGTNLEMEAVETMAAQVGEEGDITVPVAMLNDIVRNLPQGAQINMAMNKRQIAVTSGRSRFNLPTLPATDFPQMWSTNWTNEFEIDGEKLSYMLGRVSFAQDDRTAYASRMGVYAHRLENGRLRFVATDGGYIALIDGPEVGEFEPCTIPTRMVAEIARMVGRVKLVFGQNLIMVRSDQSTVTSKLIDRSMKFPEYGRALPDASPNAAVVNVDSLQAAIRRAMIARDPSAKDQTIRMEMRPGAMSITARNQIADAFDEIDIEYDGPQVTLTLTPSRVLDILATLMTDSVCVGFGDNKTALQWVSPGDEDGKAVLMPQRVA